MLSQTLIHEDEGVTGALPQTPLRAYRYSITCSNDRPSGYVNKSSSVLPQATNTVVQIVISILRALHIVSC